MHWERAQLRSCARGTLYVFCAATLLGACSGGPADTDDGGSGSDAEVGSARLFIEVSAEREEDEVTLATGRTGLAELRARNDRGGDLEPRLEAVGSVDLTASDPIDVGDVIPATYGRVTMRLEAGDWGPAFQLELVHAGGTVTVESRDGLNVDVRCEVPIRLAPGDDGELRVELDTGEVWSTIAMTGPVDGEVRIDAESDPSRLAGVEAAFAGAWSVSCEGGVEGSAEALETE
jgi:hypothetical protein